MCFTNPRLIVNFLPNTQELGGSKTVNFAVHPRSKSLPDKSILDKKFEETNGYCYCEDDNSVSSLDQSSIDTSSVTVSPSISRESDSSETPVFDDSASSTVTSPDILETTSNDEVPYSLEEMQYNKLKKVSDFSLDGPPKINNYATDPGRRHTTASKFYVDSPTNSLVSRKVSVPARRHLPASEKERVRKVLVCVLLITQLVPFC